MQSASIPKDDWQYVDEARYEFIRKQEEMKTNELIGNAHFVTDTDGNKTAVQIDYAAWEELLTLLEDLEDAEEIRRSRDSGEEAIPWEQAKAELRSKGIDV